MCMLLYWMVNVQNAKTMLHVHVAILSSFSSYLDNEFGFYMWKSQRGFILRNVYKLYENGFVSLLMRQCL